MERVAALVEEFFGLSGGELLVGGIPIATFVGEYGTPFFLYDGGVLDRKWNIVRATYPQNFTIYYSVKANPNPAILSHFLAKGCGLEVASGGEFQRALKVGCAANKVVFAGPGKSETDLELVLKHDIGEIHAESLVEIERIAAISRRIGVRARVALRVNPTDDVQGGAMQMGGKPTPFGVDEENLDSVLDRIVQKPSIEFQGVHLFTGTQILDHTLLLRQYRKALEIAKRVAYRIQRPINTVDVGGGLGIPYFAGEKELDMDGLGQGLRRLMCEIESDSVFKGTRFIVEPGRYLVGDAGLYVSRVSDIKCSRNKKFLILDGGMNHHLAASGNLGQVVKRNFPLALLNKICEAWNDEVDVVGPLCTPLDILGRKVKLPRAEIGDPLGIFQSGAYALTASPFGFLTHLTPAEVLVYKGNARLIRQRGSHDSL